MFSNEKLDGQCADFVLESVICVVVEIFKPVQGLVPSEPLRIDGERSGVVIALLTVNNCKIPADELCLPLSKPQGDLGTHAG